MIYKKILDLFSRKNYDVFGFGKIGIKFILAHMYDLKKLLFHENLVIFNLNNLE